MPDKEYFKTSAPIIMHATIEYEDIGEFMQHVVDHTGIRMGKRQCVIDSYYRKEITLIDEYFVWLLNHCAVCTQI